MVASVDGDDALAGGLVLAVLRRGVNDTWHGSDLQS
jgi:hypothetical protein